MAKADMARANMATTTKALTTDQAHSAPTPQNKEMTT